MPTLANSRQTRADAAAPSPGRSVVETPYLHLDARIVTRRYDDLTSALPGTAVHYAVKANPEPAVLAALVAAGSGFDVASPTEVVACLDAGATADQLLYSNPIKRRDDLRAAYDLGVRLFVVDCMPEMLKIVDEAPGSNVLCRISTPSTGSDRPRSHKFGCSRDSAVEILTAADSLGLSVAGVAFHLGSQHRGPDAWRAPIIATGEIFSRLEARGITPWLVDLGGGFPARLPGDHPPLTVYSDVIRDQLQQTFGDDQPYTAVAPGRAVIADAGVLHTTVIAVCWRGGVRWVYVDTSVFSGQIDAVGETIRGRVSTDHDGMPDGPVVLAGPTSDSRDVLSETDPIQLPLALKEGDRVRLHGAGAYPTCPSTFGLCVRVTV